jgi:hypothetical protein
MHREVCLRTDVTVFWIERWFTVYNVRNNMP